MRLTGVVKIKNNIDIADIGNTVEDIARFVFSLNDDGTARYAPYYMDYAEHIAVLLNLVDGIEFNENDNVFEIYKNEEKIKAVVDDYVTDGDEMIEIRSHAYDLIDFRKEEYLHKNHELDKLLEIAAQKEALFNEAMTKYANSQRKILDQQAAQNTKTAEVMSKLSEDELINIERRFANGDFNSEEIADMVVKSYLAQSDDKREREYKETIDEKNKTIIDLKSRLEQENK